MNDDPRLDAVATVVHAYINGQEDGWTITDKHKVAESMLAAADAVDPLRGPNSVLTIVEKCCVPYNELRDRVACGGCGGTGRTDKTAPMMDGTQQAIGTVQCGRCEASTPKLGGLHVDPDHVVCEFRFAVSDTLCGHSLDAHDDFNFDWPEEAHDPVWRVLVEPDKDATP